jgi:tetratricopeptide (TPR) repeat protein
MLETIREYAVDRLEASGEAKAARKRHTEFFLSVAEQADIRMTGTAPAYIDRADYPKCEALLDVDHDNLRATLRRALDRGEGATALRLAVALHWYWMSCERSSEGGRWLADALAQAGNDHPLRARGLLWSAHLEWSDFDRKLRLYREASDLARQAQDSYVAGFALAGLVEEAIRRGDIDGAAQWAEECRATSESAGNTFGLQLSLLGLGMVANHRGRHEEAVDNFERLLQIAAATGAGRPGQFLWELGASYAWKGDFDRAESLLTESLEDCRAGPWQGGIARVSGYLGWLELKRGDAQAAAAHLSTGVELAWNEVDLEGAARSLEGLACAWDHTKAKMAATLWGAIEAWREANRFPLEPYLRETRVGSIASARQNLDPREWEVAWARGRRLSFEEAVALALPERWREAPP